MEATKLLQRQIDYKTMRVIVGTIAILLSPVVWLLSNTGGMLVSVSSSYWTDSRDIFVGSLLVVGFFLSAYNGASGKKDLEFILSKIACFFAVCTAFFPADPLNSLIDIPAKWIRVISHFFGTTSGTIHFITSVLLFGCLIVMMWFFSFRAQSKGKTGRAYFYRIVTILMVVGAIVLFFLRNVFHLDKAMFWVEFWELTLFGLGWFVAGSYKSR